MRRGRLPKLLEGLVPAAVLLLTPTPESAGSEPWTGGGPSGGHVVDLAVDPSALSTLYAATLYNGVFKSTDGGVNWAPPGLPGAPAFGITRLTVGPTGSVHVLQDCYLSLEVLTSADGGSTWTSSDTGLEASSRCPQAIRVDPVMASLLYVGTEGEGVFKSVDSGASWAASNTGITDKSVEALAIDPATPSTVYAGTAQSGVFKSADSGASWAPMNSGLTSLTVNALMIDPLAPLTLYAGTRKGVFKSADGGASWAPANSGLPGFANSVQSLGLDPASPSTLYVGMHDELYRSTDGGANWSITTADTGGVRVNAIQAGGGAPSVIYAATDAGIAGSIDAGINWAAFNSGLEGIYVVQIVPQVPDGKSLFVVSYSAGVYNSRDSGVTWNAVNEGLDHPEYADGRNALSVCAADPDTLYLSLFEDVALSMDGGGTWVPRVADPSEFGPFGPRIGAVAAHPTNPAVVFAGALVSLPGGMTLPALLRSDDSGAHWDPVSQVTDPLTSYEISEIVVGPLAPASVYAGALIRESGPTWGHQVLRSTDDGKSFSEVLYGANYSRVWLAMDPAEPATVYAMTFPVPTMVHRTLNGGLSWTALTSDLLGGVPYDIATHPKKPGRVYLAVSDKVLASRDAGDTWTELDTDGLPTHNGVRSIAVTTGAGTTIHAGTTGGVYAYTSSCGFSEDLKLASQTVDDTRAFIACQQIIAGSGFQVVYAGVVRLEAGETITLEDGFSVEGAAELVAIIEPF